jgi:hypothetical protein
MLFHARLTGLTLGLALTLALPSPAPAQQPRNSAAPRNGGNIGLTANPFASVPYAGPNTLWNNLQFGNPYLNPAFSGQFSTNTSSGTSSGTTQPQGIQRSTTTLANPLNFWQYGQVTGVGPTTGTVGIANTFGILGMQSYAMGLNNNPTGTQGDSAPPGVGLSVNYAQQFFPNQTLINNPYAYSPSPYGYPGAYGAPGFGNPGAYNPYGNPYGPFSLGLPGASGSKGFFGNGENGL